MKVNNDGSTHKFLEAVLDQRVDVGVVLPWDVPVCVTRGRDWSHCRPIPSELSKVGASAAAAACADVQPLAVPSLVAEPALVVAAVDGGLHGRRRQHHVALCLVGGVSRQSPGGSRGRPGSPAGKSDTMPAPVSMHCSSKIQQPVLGRPGRRDQDITPHLTGLYLRDELATACLPDAEGGRPCKSHVMPRTHTRVGNRWCTDPAQDRT